VPAANSFANERFLMRREQVQPLADDGHDRPQFNTEAYDHISTIHSSCDTESLATFSIDVDTAPMPISGVSHLESGAAEMFGRIEEMINYFTTISFATGSHPIRRIRKSQVRRGNRITGWCASNTKARKSSVERPRAPCVPDRRFGSMATLKSCRC